MQCFCNNEKASGADYKANYESKDHKGKVNFNKPICMTYFNELSFSSRLSWFAAVFIIAVNEILKPIIYNLVNWVG